METKAETMPIKTPKNLTNHKLDSDQDQNEKLDQRDIDDIDDETLNPDEDYDAIEDFYDNENTPEKVRNAEDPDVDGAEDDNDEIDMDYSQSQLDDFLKSQSNRGLNSQTLVKSFISTYNKTRG